MNTHYLGIHVSKNKLDTFVSGFHWEIQNNLSGFKALHKLLKKHNLTDVHVCLESTGKYGNSVALYFHQKNYTVSIINPALIKSFAKSLSLRNKTDKLDAQTIAKYAEINKPKPWIPSSQQVNDLIELTRTINDLGNQKRSLENRIEAGLQNKKTIQSLKIIIKSIEKEIKELEESIENTINSYKELKEKQELLKSIPGISDKTAGMILAETKGGIETFHSGRALAAHVGITPALKHSGISNYGGHISRQGNSYFRSKLYFPTLSAIRHNHAIKEFYERLLSKGKSKMSAICACMRKLIHIVYGVLKNKKKFDLNYTNFAFSS